MGHDPIKYALWIGSFSLVITFGCGLYIAWINGGSRNLALGLGALAGACVIFGLQLLFELKCSTSSDDFVVEFVVDYQQKSVRSPRAYHQSAAVAASRYLLIEIEASNTVASTTPPLAKDDAPKITRDLGIVSIISYLLNEQPDWQLDARSYRTSIGTMQQWARSSTPKECSLISFDTIREKLQAAGNMFADIQIGMMGDKSSLCLPPHALLEITQSSVAIRSFVCSIVVTLQEPFTSTMTIDPNVVATARATGAYPLSAITSTLPDGLPRYVTVDIAARTTVEFGALRAQDRDLAKYQKWANRLVEGVKARFELPE